MEKVLLSFMRQRTEDSMVSKEEEIERVKIAVEDELCSGRNPVRA